MEGKSSEGHEVGSLVEESDRGYAKGGKARGGAEVAILGSLSGYFASLFA
jgi:hypothetical protein